MVKFINEHRTDASLHHCYFLTNKVKSGPHAISMMREMIYRNEPCVGNIHFLLFFFYRCANSSLFARIKFNKNRDIKYTIQRGKLILISECYENIGENRFSDSFWIRSPVLNMHFFFHLNFHIFILIILQSDIWLQRSEQFFEFN